MDISIPKDLIDLIDELIAYEKTQETEEEFEYEYAYDYSEYPEHDDSREEPKKESTIIKIDL